MSGEEYDEAMKLMKDLYEEIDMEVFVILEDGYMKGQEMTITINDSVIDAVNDSQIAQDGMDETYDAYGVGSDLINDLDILFEIQMYNKVFYEQLNEELVFFTISKPVLFIPAIS